MWLWDWEIVLWIIIMTMFLYEQPIHMYANYQYTSQTETVHYSVTKTEVRELRAVIEGLSIN